jgi:ABC-type multidrug transport system ATPase subunit
MGEPAIAVQGLRKSFEKKEAVAGIDLRIAAGSLAGLVGPNGVVTAEVRLFERLSGEELLEYAGRLRGLPAAYGLCFAWLGVRAAAVAAEGRLPELCQIAMRTTV